MKKVRANRVVLFVLFVVLGTAGLTKAQTTLPSANDPIAQNLALAKRQHLRITGDAKNRALDWIDRRINTATDSSDLASVTALQTAAGFPRVLTIRSSCKQKINTTFRSQPLA